MRGLKYHKTIETSFSQETFNTSLEDPDETIFYFLFSPEGLQESSSTKLTNLVETAENSRYALTINQIPETRTILTKNFGEAYMYNSLGWDTIFDGIACKDKKRRLFFDSETAFASSQVEVGFSNTINEITIELWFKPTKADKSFGKRNLLMITKNGEPFIKIMKDLNGNLRCFPFSSLYGQITDYAVEYFDYQDGEDNEIWHHISCVVDQQNNKIWGTLFTHQKDGTF